MEKKCGRVLTRCGNVEIEVTVEVEMLFNYNYGVNILIF